MAHALMAPSAAKRWLACPGSVRACEGLSSPNTRYSAEGTYLHGIAARVLSEDLDSAADLVGTTGTEAGFSFVLDKDAAAAVDEYVNAVRVPVMLGGELHVEKPVLLTEQCHGTADAIVWSADGRTLHVFDLKMGSGVFVAVEGNEQMMTYAAAALATFGTPAHLLDEIVLHVVQPRCRDSEGRAHRSWSATPADVLEHARKISAVELVVVHGTKPADLVAGDHCRFCPTRNFCPAVVARATEAAQELFAVESLNELPVTAKPAAPPMLAQLPTERLVAILDAADAVDQWVRAVRGEAMARALRGVALPGRKLVRGLGNRRWKSDVDTANTMAQHGVEPWAPRVLASPAQLEKKHPDMKALIGLLTERPLGEPKLVPESDKRPAYVPDPAADFSALSAPEEFF